MRTRDILPWLLTVVLSSSITILFGADIFSGTWKVNTAKSTFNPGPGLKAQIVTFEAVGSDMKVVVDSTGPDGTTIHSEWLGKFDGKDYPEHPMLDGKPNPNAADMISVKKIDDYTYETVAKQKGKVLVTTKNVVSKDGKTRTATATGTDAQGRAVNNTVVWEKQ